MSPLSHALGSPLPMAITEAGTLTTGESTLVVVVGAITVLLALGLIFARKAAHAAICLVGVMVSFAVLYIAQEAPFLGVVQIIVYTGAVMMLFLFVLMLIGVDAADSTLEAIKGQRLIAVLAGLGIVGALLFVLSTVNFPGAVGLAGANADTNPTGIARLLFSEHVLAVELAAAMLVVAAVGALTLSHKQRLRPVLDQRATAVARMEQYAEGTRLPTSAPAPGLYARGTAATQPALGATGRPVVDSVPTVLRIRGQVRSLGELSPESLEAIAAQQTGHEGQEMHGGDATRSVGQSRAAGMRGAEAPEPAGLDKQRRIEAARLEQAAQAEEIEKGEDQ